MLNMVNKIRIYRIMVAAMVIVGLALPGCHRKRPEKKAPAPAVLKAQYDQLFQVNGDGSVSAKLSLNINGALAAPGTKFIRGVQFSGVDITQYIGHDIDVQEEDGGFKIIKFY
ncbi:hypothetical protein FO488_05610 [Geobacter sp. FeAm09]|uniref:hypothetical protein n=1 Tax=Geobacter sp. FeAm09 TaxID=2597769 RepID=UPI0011EEF233|nr:hypothetical protein [Geobacter sp. FeAm09]QEM67679.1 hypothetical protein FO488_05610 [Geobacter sp. FeAm09]